MYVAEFFLFASFILNEKTLPLRIAENQRVGWVTAFCSHERDLFRSQKWLAILTDAATQVQIPKREFLLGVTQGHSPRTFLGNDRIDRLILMFVVFGIP